MRYRNDFLNTAPSDSPQQFMTRPCGIYNSGLTPAGTMPMAGPQMGMQPVSAAPMGTQPMNVGVAGTQQALPALPTGYPTGGAPAPLLPTAVAGIPPVAAGAPTALSTVQIPQTVENPLYTPGFLRTQIGKRMRVEFLIGTNNLTDRTGTLLAVGASYIVLRPIDSDDMMLCDIYSIKFVTIIL